VSTLVAIVNTCEILGIEAIPVKVEVDISPGLPKFNIVGLPDTSVNESKERVRAALKNSELKFPMKRISINLAPAHLKKLGSRYDLAIAVGILVSSGEIESRINLDNYLFVGELSLDGRLNHVNGILPLAILARKLKMTLIIPKSCLDEASIINGVKIIPVGKLSDVAKFLSGGSTKIVEGKYNFEIEKKTKKMGTFQT
jgi:magnesium chelatase family protein